MGATASVVDSKAISFTLPKEDIVKYDAKDGPFWNSSIESEMRDLVPPSGQTFTSEDSVTLIQLLDKCAENYPTEYTMKAERPCPPLEGKTAPPALPVEEWKGWSFSETRTLVRSFAKASLSFGAIQHDSVVVFGFNSPEWLMSALGAVYAGGQAAGIYPSDTAEQVYYKTLHSGASIASLEGKKEFETLAKSVENLPYLKVIVVWNKYDGMPKEIPRSDGSKCLVLTWEQYLEHGHKQPNEALNDMSTKIKQGHCCILIYTSGTTGQPKAVMLSHRNLIFDSNSFLSIARERCGDLFNEPGSQRCTISYLPLSHIAGFLMDIVFALVCSAQKERFPYLTIHFARPYDLKVGSLVERMRAIRPHIFLGVPRVWEKMEEKLRAIGAANKGAKKKLINWAKGKGLEQLKNMQLGGSGAVPFGHGLANKLVLSKVKEKLGLDRASFGLTGAAPIRKTTQEFFAALGISICEVYGMSESTGCTTYSVPNCTLWGSVGYSLPGTEVKVFRVDPEDSTKKEVCPEAKDVFNPTEAEQGEICFRGPHIMMGYLANPLLGEDHMNEIKKKNEEAIDREGWLHSGDKGAMSSTGFFRVTGRYKELILGAGGENIAPVPIEDCVKQFAAISNAIMIGDQRKYNVMLITLKAVGATGEFPGGDELEPQFHGVSPGVTKVSEAMKDPQWIQRITTAITNTNNNGECCPSNAAKVQKFTILPRDLSVTTGDFTATLKLKRSVVEKRFMQQIDKMYATDGVYVPYEE